MSKLAVEKQIQTNETDPNEDYDNFRQPRASETTQEVNRRIESPKEPCEQSRGAHNDNPGADMRPNDHSQAQQSDTIIEPKSRRYPT